MKASLAVIEFLHAGSGSVSAATVRWYRERLRPLTVLGKLRRVDTRQLRAVWLRLTERAIRWPRGRRPPADGGLSPFTLDGYYRAWRSFFKWCVDQEYIEKNPALKLRRPILPDQPPKALADDDLIRLLAAAECRRDYAVLCVLALTSCRVGGLVSMTVDDLDLVTGRVVVIEKGRGGGKRRVVYVHGQALTALRAYVHTERRWGECRAVWLTAAGGALTDDGVRMILRRLKQKAGVRGRVNPHAFRHRFARNLIDNGADIGTVSQLMGHSSIDVTNRFYARWDDAELKAKHSRFATLPTTEDS